MLTLEIKKQKKMPFTWLLNLSLASMAHQIVRSFVTVIIITLAIAFLTYIMLDSYIGSSVRDTVLKKVDKITIGTRFIREINTLPSNYTIILKMRNLKKDDAFYSNIKRWSGFTDASMNVFADQCAKAGEYIDFFKSIPAGRRVILVENNTDLKIFDWLASSPDNFTEYQTKLAKMPSIKMPTLIDDFKQFILQWPMLQKKLATIRMGYKKTIDRIKTFIKNKSIIEVINNCKTDAERKELFLNFQKMGFTVDTKQQQFIINDLIFQSNLTKAMLLIKNNKIRTGWFRKFQEKFSPTEALKQSATSNKHLDWIYKTAGTEADSILPKKTFEKIAAQYLANQNILALKLPLVQKYGKTGSMNQRATWLIIVSFMVCVVGIANAMLMTVLERFKEIATMKCLGARNDTIGHMFLLESFMIGVIGALVGIIIGFIIAFLMQLIDCGSLVFENIPLDAILITSFVSFACGLFLALLAAIYPAVVASKMAPMEAMRVD